MHTSAYWNITCRKCTVSTRAYKSSTNPSFHSAWIQAVHSPFANTYSLFSMNSQDSTRSGTWLALCLRKNLKVSHIMCWRSDASFQLRHSRISTISWDYHKHSPPFMFSWLSNPCFLSLAFLFKILAILRPIWSTKVLRVFLLPLQSLEQFAYSLFLHLSIFKSHSAKKYFVQIPARWLRLLCIHLAYNNFSYSRNALDSRNRLHCLSVSHTVMPPRHSCPFPLQPFVRRRPENVARVKGKDQKLLHQQNLAFREKKPQPSRRTISSHIEKHIHPFNTKAPINKETGNNLMFEVK